MTTVAETTDWTLGAVFEERRLNPDTRLFVVRADAPAAAARDLERCLIAARYEGSLTVVVELVHSTYASGPLIATLTRADRKLGVRNGRLLVGAEAPELLHTLECAGLDTSTYAEPEDAPPKTGRNHLPRFMRRGRAGAAPSPS